MRRLPAAAPDETPLTAAEVPMRPLPVITALLVCCTAIPAAAEVKVIEAANIYQMGDNDSRNDARRICVQEAKRKALELAGTYVSSLTQVKNYRLTKDEVTSYTAGMIAADIVSEEMRGSADRPEIVVKVRCSIDTSVLMKQLGNFRENDELKAQLDTAARENEKLRKERDALLASMQAEKDKTRTEEKRKQVDSLLSRQEGNDETMKYWRSLAHRAADPDQPVDAAELAEATAALSRIANEDPKNGRARFLLASIHQRSRDYAAAEREIRSALAQAPDDPYLHLKLGVLLKEDRKFDAALQELLIAQKGLGDKPGVLFHLSRTYYFLDDCGKAADPARRFLERSKRDNRPEQEKMRVKALQVLKNCDRGEAEGPRRRR